MSIPARSIKTASAMRSESYGVSLPLFALNLRMLANIAGVWGLRRKSPLLTSECDWPSSGHVSSISLQHSFFMTVLNLWGPTTVTPDTPKLSQVGDLWYYQEHWKFFCSMWSTVHFWWVYDQLRWLDACSLVNKPSNHIWHNTGGGEVSTISCKIIM